MTTARRHVEVSSHSREVARSSPHLLMEKYVRERDSLVAEKQAAEARLSDLDAEKRERALRITQKRLHGRDAIQATQALEVEFAGRKKEITRDLQAINERLQAMKKLMHDKGAFQEENQRDILRRIEQLLQRIVFLAERGAGCGPGGK